jgi:hypothetical protein
VLSPEHANWPRRRTVIAAELGRLRSDVIALQEIVWDDRREIVELLGNEYDLVPHSARSPDGGRWRAFGRSATPRSSIFMSPGG